MKFTDQLGFIFQHLKRSKLRVVMTILATTIGCAFLIILASVAFGLQQTFEDEVFSNTNVTEIKLWNGENLSEQEIEDIEKINHVNAVIERNSLNMYVNMAFEDRTGSTNGAVYDMNAYDNVPSLLQAGRVPQNENEIIVGMHLGSSLLNEADKKAIEEKNAEAEKNGTWYNGEEEGYKGELLNKNITLTLNGDNGEPLETRIFTIVGVKQEPAYEREKDTEIQFHQDLLTAIPTQSFYTDHKIYIDTMENVLPVVEELEDKGLQVYSPLQQVKEIKMVFLVVKIGMIFIGTIAVFIASIGIFNTMTMAVTERTREIGILKAIGATPSLIQRLFLMESVLIGVIGTALAIVISYVISIAGNFAFPLIMKATLLNGEDLDFELTFSVIPLSLLLIASGISIFVAIISGWRPARKATKIEVVKALQQI